MRLPPRAPRCLATFVLVIAIVVLPSSIATAGPILLNFNVTLNDGSPVSDSAVAVSPGAEISYGNGTNVGELFFDDEFIDITSTAATTSLAYMIQGGLAAHPVAAGYSTSWQAGTTLLFSNFVLDQPGTLASVSVNVNKVVGAAGGGLVGGVDYLFTTNSLLLNIGSLGILEQAGQTPLGSMTFQLSFVADQPTDPPNPVPDAGWSLTLFGMGMAALATRQRWARRRQ
jgi:hypothetical protein